MDKLRDNLIYALESLEEHYIYHYTLGDITDAIFLIYHDGRAISRLYWYHDDNTTVYLDMLSVDREYRKVGIGLELQVKREEMGKILGAKNSILWVVKNTWMHAWYKRRGYKDYIDHKKEKNAIWMKKDI